MKVTLQSYGACNEVTGSKHFLKINDKYILIDYGMWQGSQDDDQKNREFKCPIPIEDIETVILNLCKLTKLFWIKKILRH